MGAKTSAMAMNLTLQTNEAGQYGRQQKGDKDECKIPYNAATEVSAEVAVEPVNDDLVDSLHRASLL